ncbi:MAG TPA: PLP-dependent aminotransferase family protein [Ktedonobacterales bacterium]|nr:PLP-dependent aminotransferase family protein [Ktedonobacterales bacterium]
MKEQRHFARENRRHFALAALSDALPDDVELVIQLKRVGRPSLQRQLLDQLRRAIQGGLLAPGRRLPATRPFASALGISRHIVEAVYDELAIEGYLVRRRGSGTSVNRELAALAPPHATPPESARDGAAPRWLRPAPPVSVAAPALNQHMIVFGPGAPDLSLLPMRVWRSAWRAVGAQLPTVAYGPAAGDPDLRAALARYLRQARGVICAPEDVIITTSAAQAVDLVTQATISPGESVGFEEPGYPIARQIMQERGARILPIPVDDDGLRVDALPLDSEAPKLVYVTPSHQYPLGGRLPVARRMALLCWATACDSLLIEDDYDSEFRFDAAPLPALTALDRDGRVVYIGTFSKIVTPALRVGYLVTLQPELRERIIRLKALHGFHASWPSQRALLALIAERHLERHIRRMRRHYADKRVALCEALAPLAPLARICGIDAGLHACLDLRPDLSARDIAHEALARGVVVPPLDAYYYGSPQRQGLALGYGGLDRDEIIQGARILHDVIAAAADRAGAEPTNPLSG